MAELNYGGQAVMEGVMMRGSKAMAVAVRAPSGEIVIHSEPLSKAVYDSWISRVPFVRGVTVLWDTLVLGLRTLMFSAEIAVQEAEQDGSETPSRDVGDAVFSGPLAWGTIAASLAVAVGLFFVLPALLTKLVDRYVATALLSNLIEGLIRLTFVVGYVSLVGFLPDIRRVFAYHGAEHKTVHAYEAGRPLTVEGVRSQSTAHERCGTAFLLVVAVISILIFALLGRPNIFVRIASRVVLIPLVVGVAYEWLKFGSRHSHTWWMRMLLFPGLLMQQLTTREPDDSMIEVAIAAMGRVLEAEGQPIPGQEAVATR